ncbi:hypothetical protein C8J25_107271 [Sphingomonas faeni]|uniref:Uncharacterized protein n=1 Tax=Sphingomonas faeni TaxID=185950 RepID=A0A2T5U247_9SPHN|nr:hypothetical protein [Sphingomonas faeni]PTW45586.1 hypothetical protein C8J25_107271 [Sphingomonas faeni]
MADWTDLLRGGPDPSDVGAAFGQGQAQAVALRQARLADQQKQVAFQQQQQYRSRVADLLKGNDINGAAAQAAAYGDDKASANFIAIQKNKYDQGAAGAGSFGEVVRGIAALPYEQRSGALAAATPTLQAMGYGREQIAGFDPTDQNLAAVGGLGYSAKDRAGDQQAVYDGQTGRQNADTARITAENPVVVGGSLVTRGGEQLFKDQQFFNAPTTDNVYQVGGVGSNGYTQTTQNLAPGSITAEQLYRTAIEPQESGGRAGVSGPATRYGTAQGASQMLPGTARSMAAKLGVKWRPELMTDKTPAGLAYQRQLGVAYAQEALDKTGGDPRAAAMFYHGGPDRSIWGPKTQAYGDRAVRSLTTQAVGQQPINRAPQIVQQGVAKPPAGSQPKPLSEKDMGIARTKLAQSQRLKAQIVQLQQLDPEGGALSGARPSSSAGIYGGVIGGRVSGALVGGDTDRFDTLVSNIRNTITAVTRVPGIGSQSDYEARLAAATMPERTRSASGRAQAYSEIYQIASDMEKEMLAQSQGGFGGRQTQQAKPTSAVPAGAAQMLRSNPNLRAQFDAKYGAGASASVLGS